MIKIENSYEKINKDVTKTFEAKHEILKKEETEIKDKLENEVNKIKKNLEFNLSKINVLVRNIETLLKTRNTFLEQKDEIMIKKLNYISKISKNQKQMEMLFQQQIKNLRIVYTEGERKIKYEEYYFNGIPIPKNIEINDLNSNNFKLIWQIDNENKSNIDIKQIKYKVEIKKENEEFIPAYEGNEPNCAINNLEPLTNFEIRLCSFYNEIMSDWIEIYKIKTKSKIDSSILNNCEKEKEFINKIFEWSGGKSLELLYRGTKDGMTAEIFHEKCDNQGKTICLFLNKKDNIFGGYSSIPWAKGGGGKISEDCFLFTLTNIYNTEPTKFPYNKSISINLDKECGPVFGDGADLFFGNVSGDFTIENSNGAAFPYSYDDTLGKGKSIFTGDFDNENYYFKIKEIEVFRLKD